MNITEPHIKIAGLRIQILSRDSSDSADFWDANWLNAVISCRAQGSSVEVTGNLLHLSELEDWLKGLEAIHQNLSGEADLNCNEPNLRVQIAIGRQGQGFMNVAISPDPVTQTHEYAFDIDQSYLPDLIAQLRRVLQDFPIKGNRE